MKNKTSNLRKVLGSASIVLALALPMSVQADEAFSACQAVLCLGAIAVPEHGFGSNMLGPEFKDCKPGVPDYFDIKRTKRGSFSCSRTRPERRKFLDKCKEVEHADAQRFKVDLEKNAIDAMFGCMPDMPGNWF